MQHLTCLGCGHAWDYKGKSTSPYVTCPSCLSKHRKNEEPVLQGFLNLSMSGIIDKLMKLQDPLHPVKVGKQLALLIDFKTEIDKFSKSAAELLHIIINAKQNSPLRIDPIMWDKMLNDIDALTKILEDLSAQAKTNDIPRE